MKKTSRKLLSLVLTLVMALSMITTSGITALATGTTGQIDEGSDGSGSTGEVLTGIENFEWIARGQRFVRFTVVQLLDGADNWQDYGSLIVLGTKDYSDSTTYLNLASSVKVWWKSNALSAANYGEQPGQTWAGYFKGVSMRGIEQYTLTNFTAKFGVALPDVSGDSTHVITGSTENRFQAMFTDEQSDGSRTPNALFDNLVRDITGEAIDSKYFIDNDCRLVIEPGGFTYIAGEIAALTLRDLIAYDTNGPTDYATNVRRTWYGASVRMLAYGLFTTRDELGEYDADGNWQVCGGTAAIKKVDKDTDISDSYKYPHFKATVPTQGYGLAIVTPTDIGAESKFDSYVGRVNIYIPTEAGLTASGSTGDYGVETYSYVGNKAGLAETLFNLPQDYSTASNITTKTMSARNNQVLGGAKWAANIDAFGISSTVSSTGSTTASSTYSNPLYADDMNTLAWVQELSNLGLQLAGLTDDSFTEAANVMNSAMATSQNGSNLQKYVSRSVPTLKNGVEWSQIGEVVLNIEEYKGSTSNKGAIDQSRDVTFEWLGQSVAKVIYNQLVNDCDETNTEVYTGSSSGMGGMITSTIMNYYMGNLESYIENIKLNCKDASGQVDTAQVLYTLISKLKESNGMPTGGGSPQTSDDKLHTVLGVMNVRQLCMMAPKMASEAIKNSACKAEIAEAMYLMNVGSVKTDLTTELQNLWIDRMVKEMALGLFPTETSTVSKATILNKAMPIGWYSGCNYYTWLDNCVDLDNIYSLSADNEYSLSSSEMKLVGYAELDESKTSASGLYTGVKFGEYFNDQNLYYLTSGVLQTLGYADTYDIKLNYYQGSAGQTRGTTGSGSLRLGNAINNWATTFERTAIGGSGAVEIAAAMDEYAKDTGSVASISSSRTTNQSYGSPDMDALVSLIALDGISSDGDNTRVELEDTDDGFTKYSVTGSTQLSVAVYAPSIKGDSVLVTEVTNPDGSTGYEIVGVVYNDISVSIGNLNCKQMLSSLEAVSQNTFGTGYYIPQVGILAGYADKGSDSGTQAYSINAMAKYLVDNKAAIEAGTDAVYKADNAKASTGTSIMNAYGTSEYVIYGVSMDEAFGSSGYTAEILNNGVRKVVDNTTAAGQTELNNYLNNCDGRFKQVVLVDIQDGDDITVVKIYDGGPQDGVVGPDPVTPDTDGNVDVTAPEDYDLVEWKETENDPEDVTGWNDVPSDPEDTTGTTPKVPTDEDTGTIYVHYRYHTIAVTVSGNGDLTESRITMGTSLAVTASTGLQKSLVTTSPEWYRWCPGHTTLDASGDTVSAPCPDADKGGCQLATVSWGDKYDYVHGSGTCTCHAWGHDSTCAIYDAFHPGSCDCGYADDIAHHSNCVAGKHVAEWNSGLIDSCGQWSLVKVVSKEVSYTIGWANSGASWASESGATVAAGEWAGVFAPLYSYDGAFGSSKKNYDLSSPWDYAESEYMTSHLVNMYFSMFRGSDRVTIATLENDNYTNSIMSSAGLKLPTGTNQPTGTRASGDYSDSVTVLIDGMDTSTNDTTSWATINNKSGSTANYHGSEGSIEVNGIYYDVDISVDVFRDPSAGVGNATASGGVSNTITIGGKQFTNVVGTAVNNASTGTDAGKVITYYPYVRMYYGTSDPSTNQLNTVNVLADKQSTFNPIDYVEVGYRYKSSSTGITVNSTQWSTHSTAVGKWGKNSVLPGGAIYSLSVASGQETEVGASIWFTYIPSDNLSKVTGGASTYTYAAQMADVGNYITTLRNAMESYDIVEMLEDNSSTSADPVKNGIEIQMAGGQTLFDGQKSSNDAKYWLLRGTYGTSANSKSNRADLDVVADQTLQTFYGVWADVNGNVYVGKSSTEAGVKSNVIASIDKYHTASDLVNANDDTKALDARTKLITNFVATLDRNKGNDTSLSDPQWYNEAFDGIYVCRQDVILTMGFSSSNPKRTAAIDPKQEAPRSSQSALFADANAAAFRVSKAPTIEPSVNGYVGKFKGQNVIITNPQYLLTSRKFYIPNVSVTDLY